MRAYRGIAVALCALFALGLSSCATAAPQASPTPTQTQTPSPTPSGPPADPVADFADETLAAMTNTQRVASMLMLHQPGTDGASLGGFVEDHELGGLILMGDNIPPDEANVASMTAAIQSGRDLPILIAIDQEGGWVSRLEGDVFAGADVLKYEPADATASAFAARAALLASLGINVNFGIVADVTADPNSFIFDRVLGTDPAAAAERVAAAVTAENGVVASTIKHFPGHGSAPGDSHTGIPSTDLTPEAWAAGEQLSFAAGIGAGAQLVMFGHLSYTAVDVAPSSLSARWHQLLRDEMGFDGVTITDDMLMLQHSELPELADPTENAIRAIEAGNDMLLYVLPSDPASEGIEVDALIGAVVAAIESGRLSQQQVDDSVWRLLYLRQILAV